MVKLTAVNINHPTHYNQGVCECIDVMEQTQGRDAVMGFCVCNAFKYLYRHREKGGIEDIEKAIWYLQKYKEVYDKKNESEDTNARHN